MEKKQKSKEVKIESEKKLYYLGAIMVGLAIGQLIWALIEGFLWRDFPNGVLLIVYMLLMVASLLFFVVAATLKVSLRLKSIEELLRETANKAKQAKSAAEEEKA